MVMTRGSCRPLANSDTLKPFITWGFVPSGRSATPGVLLADLVANGSGMSDGLIRSLRPGSACSQLPKAFWPVRRSWEPSPVPAACAAVAASSRTAEQEAVQLSLRMMLSVSGFDPGLRRRRLRSRNKGPIRRGRRRSLTTLVAGSGRDLMPQTARTTGRARVGCRSRTRTDRIDRGWSGGIRRAGTRRPGRGDAPPTGSLTQGYARRSVGLLHMCATVVSRTKTTAKQGRTRDRLGGRARAGLGGPS